MYFDQRNRLRRFFFFKGHPCPEGQNLQEIYNFVLKTFSNNSDLYIHVRVKP